jgi:hypothetical protein
MRDGEDIKRNKLDTTLADNGQTYMMDITVADAENTEIVYNNRIKKYIKIKQRCHVEKMTDTRSTSSLPKTPRKGWKELNLNEDISSNIQWAAVPGTCGTTAGFNND